MSDIVSVVNIIPHLSSGEANQDSEPNLAVNPANPEEMVATAFTPSPNLSTTKSPVFYTNDGGNTWALIDIIPGTPVRDQTTRFATQSGIGSINYGILSTNDFSGTVPMSILAQRTNDDQPFVQAATVPSGPSAGQDRIYIGSNDHNPSNVPGTLDFSLDANVAVPAFTKLVIEGRSVSRDWPQVRPAIHPNGTVYALYYADLGATFDVVIVRDDNWGIGGTPFQALIDTDGKQGIRVATGVNLPSLPSGLYIGQERVNGDLSITVDPHDSAIVYVCWGDYQSGAYTIYVSKSVDSGATWSPAIKTLGNATNACLALNGSNRLGLVYQLVTGPSANQHWQTTLELTHTDFASSVTHVLANTPAGTPASAGDPYLGDYLYMMAVGHSFYGIFSANNTPDLANFPNGVTYQRNANFSTKTLLDLSGNPVSVSIDPFVFKVVPGVGRVVTALADSGNFGRVCLGSFVDEELSINNGGTGPLLITSIVASLPDFEPPSVLTFPIKLEVGDSIEIPIRFAPVSLGPKVATISVFSNDPASPHVVKVLGDAPTPRLSLIIADSGSFGRVCVGHIADEPLVLNNSGHCPVTVFGIASSSAAFLVPQVLAYPLLMGPGDSLDIPIRFAPSGHGPAVGTITVTSSDPASPHIVSVSGDAPAGRLVVTGSLCFGGVKACCRAERTLSICNMGECALNVTSVAFKRPNPHWKLINNPFPAALPPGACLGVVIRYKATEKCPIACELVIASDDPTMPVKTLDVMAYTVWNTCSCKKECEHCGGKGCERCGCQGGCGICEGAADDCCADEAD
jgi:hypothetical protein